MIDTQKLQIRNLPYFKVIVLMNPAPDKSSSRRLLQIQPGKAGIKIVRVASSLASNTPAVEMSCNIYHYNLTIFTIRLQL